MAGQIMAAIHLKKCLQLAEERCRFRSITQITCGEIERYQMMERELKEIVMFPLGATRASCTALQRIRWQKPGKGDPSLPDGSHISFEADPIPWASSWETCCQTASLQAGWRKLSKMLLWIPCAALVISLTFSTQRQMSAECFLQHALHRTELTPLQAGPRSTWRQVLCLMAGTALLLEPGAWASPDRKPRGKMLPWLSPEPPTADEWNVWISLLSRWAKCFRPHECWLERLCVCPRAKEATLQKQEAQGCCRDRIKGHGRSQWRVRKGFERAELKPTLASAFLWRWAETGWKSKCRFKRVKLVIQPNRVW